MSERTIEILPVDGVEFYLNKQHLEQVDSIFSLVNANHNEAVRRTRTLGRMKQKIAAIAQRDRTWPTEQDGRVWDIPYGTGVQ